MEDYMRWTKLALVAAAGLAASAFAAPAGAFTPNSSADLRPAAESIDQVASVHCRPFKHRSPYHGWGFGCRGGGVTIHEREGTRARVGVHERSSTRSSTSVRSRESTSARGEVRSGSSRSSTTGKTGTTGQKSGTGGSSGGGGTGGGGTSGQSSGGQR
jgi:hypothetical protein